MLIRLRAVLAGLWAGGLVTIGGLAAPTLFQMLDKVVAGQVAGRYFFLEAKASLLLSAALLLIERAIVRNESSTIHGGPARSHFSINLVLLLGILFSVVFGYEVLHPMMEAARQGQGSWTFMQLHGVSMALFAVRTVLLLGLAWRCVGQSAKS